MNKNVVFNGFHTLILPLLSGLYFHIPFCRKACHYCDFHFSTQLKNQEQMVSAIAHELQTFTNGYEPFHTLYFGGGTPSVLKPNQLELLFKPIDLSQIKECTFEMNPDDMHADYLKTLLNIGVNRLSVGIQSFEESHLTWMNRSHNSQQALECLETAKSIGFNQLNADLIFGFDQLTDSQLEHNLETAISSGINHLSVYGLTIEPGTVLGHKVKNGLEPTPDEIQFERQFLLIHKWLTNRGWEHYEVSNYCKPGNRALHNSAYWEGKNYLGIGPGAHSRWGLDRWQNISNNPKYLEMAQQNNFKREVETLSEAPLFNEKVLTRLRCYLGMPVNELLSPPTPTNEDRQEIINSFLNNQWMVAVDGNITLTAQGMLYADHIASELMV